MANELTFLGQQNMLDDKYEFMFKGNVVVVIKAERFEFYMDRHKASI